MKWLPIDRDVDGFATEECLRKIESCYERKSPLPLPIRVMELITM